MSFSPVRILALSAIAFASTAYGQATFHLPVSVHWGQVTLAPGDYRMSSVQPATSVSVFYVHGNSRSVLEMAGHSDPDDSSKQSYLKLVQLNGEYFVREYVSGAVGKKYTFLVPKEVRRAQYSETWLPVRTEGGE